VSFLCCEVEETNNKIKFQYRLAKSSVPVSSELFDIKKLADSGSWNRLKGQPHEKVCEIMIWDVSFRTKVRQQF
jgi:hypothetical protein